MAKFRCFNGYPWSRFRVYLIEKEKIKILGKLILPTLPIAINEALKAYPQLINARWGIIEELSPTPLEMHLLN